MSRVFGCFLLLFVVDPSASIAQLTDREKAYIEYCQEARKERSAALRAGVLEAKSEEKNAEEKLKTLEEVVTGIEAARVTPTSKVFGKLPTGKYVFRTAGQKEGALRSAKVDASKADDSLTELRIDVAKLEAALAPLIDPKQLPTPYLPNKLRVGAFGKVRGKIVVEQIADKTNCRATLQLGLSKTDDRSIVEEMAWISGMSMDGFVDGSAFQSSKVFAVSGTKTYSTAIGSTKTVFLLEPFDTSAVEKFWQKQEATK